MVFTDRLVAKELKLVLNRYKVLLLLLPFLHPAIALTGDAVISEIP